LHACHSAEHVRQDQTPDNKQHNHDKTHQRRPPRAGRSVRPRFLRLPFVRISHMYPLHHEKNVSLVDKSSTWRSQSTKCRRRRGTCATISVGSRYVQGRGYVHLEWTSFHRGRPALAGLKLGGSEPNEGRLESPGDRRGVAVQVDCARIQSSISVRNDADSCACRPILIKNRRNKASKGEQHVF
jgi:hypothetical protein